MMTLAVAIVMGTAFVGTATGPPDFDEHGLGWRFGFGFSGCSFSSCSFACDSRLCCGNWLCSSLWRARGLSGGLFRRRFFRDRRFFNRRLWRCFDGCFDGCRFDRHGLSNWRLAHLLHGRDARQQCCRRRGISGHRMAGDRQFGGDVFGRRD
jgi:hypothetical protein